MRKLYWLATLLLCALPSQAQTTFATGGNITSDGAGCTVNANCVPIQMPGTASSITVTLSGTFTASLVFEKSGDSGTTWATLDTQTTTGVYTYTIASLTNFRVRSDVFTVGNVGVYLNVSAAPVVGGGLGNVTLAGTPGTGQVPTATSATTATWQTPAAGGGTWNSITDPVASFLPNMGTNTSTFNYTGPGSGASPVWSWKNTTAAIVGLSQASPFIGACGAAWHAGATAPECWNISILPGNGADAPVILTLGVTGTSTGVVTTLLPGPIQAGTVGSAGGTLTLPEGTAPSGSVANDVCYADSTAHGILCSYNNGAFAAIGGGGAVSSVFTRTGAVVAAANDYTFSQIGLAPLTTTQDIPYDNGGTLARLPIVTSGKCLGNTGGVWASLTCSGGSAPIELFAGDGSDGAVTADGTTTLTCLGAPASTVYTLTRDCYFTTLTVNTSTTIKPANYRLLAQTSITNNGTISNNGGNGGNGGNAAGATGGTAGSAGAALALGSLPATAAGKIGVVGATGVTTAATGAAGTAGTATTLGVNTLNNANTPAGLAGGNGGASVGGANAGGAGGAAGGIGSGNPIAKQLPRNPSRAEYFYTPLGVSYAPEGAIAGSGSGGAGAGDGTNAGGGGGGSGGNGAMGGFIVLISPTITNSATGLITATGGTGGNGGNGAAGVGGNAGGGGGGSGAQGGSGGAIALIYTTLTETTVVTAAAGSSGTGGSLGAGVGTGSNGVAGSTGSAALAGTIWRISLP